MSQPTRRAWSIYSYLATPATIFAAVLRSMNVCRLYVTDKGRDVACNQLLTPVAL
ncbi:hypothetical protein BDM02DRAFT_3123815 [Thelephora ganbajun]|uniref:Uncharacterized protein n=1 Tax=Thelephora ganbajun TaxID=370292 RepID=A0ACB6Z0B0_THEGA|nr:hypothetical protein BDM02DRAFT_3123815 [Thelephora ganbajun]